MHHTYTAVRKKHACIVKALLDRNADLGQLVGNRNLRFAHRILKWEQFGSEVLSSFECGTAYYMTCSLEGNGRDMRVRQRSVAPAVGVSPVPALQMTSGACIGEDRHR